MRTIRGILALLSGEDREASRDEEIAQARRDLDEALASLRLARASWTSIHTIDVEALRQALDLAERQLDVARMRLHRALTRGGK